MQLVLESCGAGLGANLAACLAVLPRLEAVSVNNSQLSPALLASLATLPRLTRLELGAKSPM